MGEYLNQITNYLLTQSWQIAILVIVIAAASWLLRNKSAHARYLLWLIVLAKCLVPPLVTVPLAVLPQERPVLLLETPPPVISEPVASPPVPDARPAVPSVGQVRTRLNVRPLLGIGWIAGVSVFVLVASAKALRTNSWLRREKKPLPTELQTTIERLFCKFGTLPRLWLIEGIGQPFVWGLLRGSIYLPADFVKIDNAEYRRGILGHELCHVMRFDAAVNCLQVIAQAIFWFHPFVWWANKRIRAEREKCCDEMTIARLGAKVRDYSIAIVNILVEEYESTRPVPSLAVAGPAKNIEERIKTMLTPGKKFHKRPSFVAATVTVLIALVTIPTALVLTARGEGQPTAQSVDKPAQLPNKPAADSEKPEQPRYTAQTFNSKVAFDVFVQETSKTIPRSIGRTPSAASLEIPACYIWWVKPSAPVKDWDLLVRQISQNKVPGLRLDQATDSDVRRLAELTDLHRLDLTGTQITDAGVSHLAGLTRLQWLDLSGTKLTDAGLEHLKGLTGLQWLLLPGTDVTDEALAHLEGLTGLKGLDLSATKITDAGLEHLKGLTGLQGLELRNTQITDAGLAHLKGLTKLQTLYVSETQITDMGLAHLKGLTGLQSLFLAGTKITDGGLVHLKGLTRLQWLDLSGTQITDAGLVHLKGLTGLQSLHLVNTEITDAGLEHLKGLTRLEVLYLSLTPITDAGLAHLKGLTGLRMLNVAGTQITDVGLGHLKGLTGLQLLFLSDKITDAGVEHLKGLTGLQYLWLGGKITDAGIEHLKGLTGLEFLGLSGTQVTDAGVQQLKQSLPNLNVQR